MKRILVACAIFTTMGCGGPPFEEPYTPCGMIEDRGVEVCVPRQVTPGRFWVSEVYVGLDIQFFDCNCRPSRNPIKVTPDNLGPFPSDPALNECHARIMGGDRCKVLTERMLSKGAITPVNCKYFVTLNNSAVACYDQ